MYFTLTCDVVFVFISWSFQNCSQPHCGPKRKQGKVLRGQCLNFWEQRSRYTEIERHLYQVRITYYSEYMKMCTKFRNICFLQLKQFNLWDVAKVSTASSKWQWCLTCHCLSKVHWLWSVLKSQCWRVMLTALFACIWARWRICAKGAWFSSLRAWAI